MAARGWGPAGPGAWYEDARRRCHSVATGAYVPRTECREAMQAPGPTTPAHPPHELPQEAPTSATVDVGADALPAPSGPTGDAFEGEGAPEIVEVVPSEARAADAREAAGPTTGPTTSADLGLGAFVDGEGEHSGAGGVCGDPGCPFCESVQVCPATGQRYTPVSREAAQVISALVGPVLSRVPYRGLDPAQIPQGRFELSPREQQGLDDALWIFLRKRGHMLGPIDDILALGAAATLIVAPRAIEAAHLRGEG